MMSMMGDEWIDLKRESRKPQIWVCCPGGRRTEPLLDAGKNEVGTSDWKAHTCTAMSLNPVVT